MIYRIWCVILLRCGTYFCALFCFSQVTVFCVSVLCKMVHYILQCGAQKYGAEILFIQQSGNESEGDTSLLTRHGFPRTLL